MKFFVTGATGFIGESIVRQLLEQGHSVIGLARSDASENKLIQAKCEVLRGGLTDLDVLEKGAKASDGVIHVAFDHGFMKSGNPDGFKDSIASEVKAFTAIGNALAGSGKSFVVAGIYAYPVGVPSNETSESVKEGHAALRQNGIEKLLSFKDKNVNCSVVRIPPITHDKGDPAFAHAIVEGAKTHKFVTRVGTGENTWITAHRDDVASVFILAALKGTPGSTYLSHSESFKLNKLYNFLSEKLNVPIEDKTVPEAAKILGFVAFVLPSDIIVTNEITRKKLGYEPKGIDFFTDLELNYL